MALHLITGLFCEINSCSPAVCTPTCVATLVAKVVQPKVDAAAEINSHERISALELMNVQGVYYTIEQMSMVF